MLFIILKIVSIYFIILLTIKFMGKREIGQLSIFDFAIILIISDVLVIAVENDHQPFYYYIVPVLILTLIQKLLAYLLLKIPKLRNVFDGESSNIVVNGVLDLHEMRKQNYNVDDLLTQLRLKNVHSLSEVKHLILETNGEISVFRYKIVESMGTSVKAKTSTTALGTGNSESVNEENFDISPFPLVVSGKIITRNLALNEVSEMWLYQEITKQGYTLDNVMFANYEYGQLFIMKTKDIQDKNTKKKNN